MPRIVQGFVRRPERLAKGLEFDRRLYIAWREFEQSSGDTYAASLSSRTIVYKGMLLVGLSEDYLKDEECAMEDQRPGPAQPYPWYDDRVEAVRKEYVNPWAEEDEPEQEQYDTPRAIYSYLDRLVWKQDADSHIGFGAAPKAVQPYVRPLEEQALIDFGVMPEFLGRIQRIVSLEPMTMDDYRDYLEMCVKLDFEMGGIRMLLPASAEKVIQVRGCDNCDPTPEVAAFMDRRERQVLRVPAAA